MSHGGVARGTTIAWSTQALRLNSERDGLRQRTLVLPRLSHPDDDLGSETTAVDEEIREWNALGHTGLFDYYRPFEDTLLIDYSEEPTFPVGIFADAIHNDILGMGRDIAEDQYVANLDQDLDFCTPEPRKTESALGILGHWFQSLVLIHFLGLPLQENRPSHPHGEAICRCLENVASPPLQPPSQVSTNSKRKFAFLCGIILVKVTVTFHVLLNIIKHGLTPLKGVMICGFLLGVVIVCRGPVGEGRGRHEILRMEHFWALVGFLTAIILCVACVLRVLIAS